MKLLCDSSIRSRLFEFQWSNTLMFGTRLKSKYIGLLQRSWYLVVSHHIHVLVTRTNYDLYFLKNMAYYNFSFNMFVISTPKWYTSLHFSICWRFISFINFCYLDFYRFGFQELYFMSVHSVLHLCALARSTWRINNTLRQWLFLKWSEVKQQLSNTTLRLSLMFDLRAQSSWRPSHPISLPAITFFSVSSSQKTPASWLVMLMERNASGLERLCQILFGNHFVLHYRRAASERADGLWKDNHVVCLEWCKIKTAVCYTDPREWCRLSVCSVTPNLWNSLEVIQPISKI